MVPALSLQVTLASEVSNLQASSSLPVPISISIHNNASSSVTLLTWNSPLDFQAGVLGVFEVCDIENGKALPIDTIKVSRKLPATSADLVEIPAGQAIDRTVKLPSFECEEGHEYSIQALGIWHAVWEMPLTEVTESHLADLTGATRGEFKSNFAHVKVNRTGNS
ncbi:hypothetical protein N7533_006392 [Penicillium manginii]|uniref:uncharacterized protein n=1 Tax=Penicillium manginii TaxID=203109 RepID=UPI00254742A8|nr:uncharacterized protein N7533_006392 [Penicillium manginii]KAJ5756849.1 hypothetical protein N7533_006392 [Penicillium manginii]